MSLPAQSDGSRRVVVRGDEVHRVTTAKTGLSQEQRARTTRYLVSMAIRTVCFLAAVFASGWLRWVFLAGAVFLPYIAVVMANAGRENDDFAGPAPVSPVPMGQLPSAPPDDDPPQT